MKSLSPESLRALIPVGMACPLCHRAHGKVTEGIERVFVKHQPGNITVPCDVGSVCLACIGPWLSGEIGGWPLARDCKPIGGAA